MTARELLKNGGAWAPGWAECSRNARCRFEEPSPAAERLRATYSLDDAGNITTEVKNKVITGGQHFKATSIHQDGRLAERRTETAGVGGLTTTTATDTFGYDGLGQQTSSASKATAYDPAGHTRSVDDRSPANADVTYVYDSSDRLISRHEPNAPPERARATLYFYWGPGGILAEEADGVGRALVRYLSDADGDPVAQQGYKISGGRADPADPAGTWKWLLADTDGNVATHLLDSGAVAEQAAFDPYGRPEKAGSSQTDLTKKGSSLGFQGALTDKVTGSVVLGARQYDPTTARFLTPDTFVAADLDFALGTDALTGNRYLFAAANPTAFFEDGHGISWKSTKKLAKRALRNPVVRIAAAVVVTAGVCAATAGVGCVAAGVAAGAVLEGANQAVNAKDRSAGAVAKAAGTGALAGLAGAGFGKLASKAVAKAAPKVGKALRGVKQGKASPRQTSDDLGRAAAARDAAGQQLGRKHATYAGGAKTAASWPDVRPTPLDARRMTS